ncbi:MAG TPA: hypothetical protein VF154_13545, partial [Terriglobales bacterium]
KQNEELIAGVDRELEADREFAVNSPMPEPEKTPQNVYCEGCHEVKPKYGMPKLGAAKGRAAPKQSEAAVHLR